MANRSGTPRKLILDGIPFRIAMDADFQKTPRITSEQIPTSGASMTKITRNHADVESVTVIADPLEYETLEGLAESLEDFPLSYTMADGSSYSTPGGINLDNYSSAENRCDLTLQPRNPDDWQLFSA